MAHLTRRQFGEALRWLADGLAGQEDLGTGLEKLRPKKPPPPPAPPPKRVTGALRSSLSAGDKVIVIQDDEGLVKKTIVDRLAEVAEEVEFWEERKLWREGMPNHVAARHYIQQLEEENVELRKARDLGDPIEDLT